VNLAELSLDENNIILTVQMLNTFLKRLCMKNIFLLIFMVVAISNYMLAQDKSKKETIQKFDPSANPFKDLKQAVKEAKKGNKRILLDVGGEWCIWCHRIDQFIDQNVDIKNYLHDNYIVLKINFSEENKNVKFLAQYPKVPGFPHFFVLDKKGKLLHSQDTGLLEKEKSYDAEKMMTFLKEWAPNLN
jgi:thioredoxin-related protein